MPLAELLIAASLFGLIVAATTPALQQVLAAFGEGRARIETQQGARAAIDRLTQDIRGAGYGGPPADFSAVAVAEPSRVVLQSDLNGDGLISDSGETIAWRLADDGVLRRDAGAGGQPIVNGVATFTLTYLDADGAITTIPSAVGAVRIQLATHPSRPPAAATAGIISALATTVYLRNR